MIRDLLFSDLTAVHGGLSALGVASAWCNAGGAVLSAVSVFQHTAYGYCRGAKCYASIEKDAEVTTSDYQSNVLTLVLSVTSAALYAVGGALDTADTAK